MPETGGSFGGADLTLVLGFHGLENLVSAYDQLLSDVARGRMEIASAEMEAAKIFREQAIQAAGGVKHAAEVASEMGDAASQQEAAYAHIFKDYRDIGKAIIELRSMATGKPAEDESGPKPERPEEDDKDEEDERKKGEIRQRISKFMAVGEQSAGAIGALFSKFSAMPMGIGGFVGLFLYGAYEEARIKAEVSRYSQMWDKVIGRSDDVGYKETQKYSSHLSHELEELVETYRMSEQQAAATTTALTSFGVGIKEASAKTRIHIGGASASVFMATAAVDQYFRLSAGTGAQMASKLMTEYGLSSKAAAERVADLAFIGQESGIGVQNFMNDMMSATGQLRQYGGTIDDAIGFAQILQRSMEEKGLEHHFAGSLAILATGQAAAGLASMSKGLQVFIAQQIFGGDAMAAYYVMKDRLLDPKSGPGVMKEMFVAAFDTVNRGRKLTQDESAYIIETLMPQLDPRSAKMIVESVEVLRRTDVTKQERSKAQKDLNDVWQKERERTEDWRVALKDMMKGMSKIGRAFFNMLTAGLSELLLGFGMLPYAIMDKFHLLSASDRREYNRLKGAFDEALHINETALDMLGEGLKGVVAGGKDLLAPAMPGINALIGSFKTPESLAMGADPEDITSFFNDVGQAFREGARRAHVRLINTGTVSGRLDTEAMGRLGAVARGEDVASNMAEAQEALREQFEDDPTFAGLDEEQIIFTGVRFTGRGKAIISYQIVSEEQADLGMGIARGSAMQAFRRTQESDVASTPRVSGAGLIQAFPLGDPTKSGLSPGELTYTAGAFGGRTGSHGAYDIFGAAGTPVYAAASGRVSMVKRGRNAWVETVGTHGTYEYGHLDPASVTVRHGQDVRAGQKLGVLAEKAYRGKSDMSGTAPHVHFGIRAPVRGGERKGVRGEHMEFYKELRAADPRSEAQSRLTPVVLQKKVHAHGPRRAGMI